MTNLYDETKFIMKQYGIKANKSLGQNFLVNGEVVENIINCSKINQNDMVIEIGPGLGVLTKYLLEKAGKVLCIELDPKMVEILEDRFKFYSNFEILNEDVLKVDLNEIIRKNKMSDNIKNVKIVANLPYYITTPIIMGLFESHVPVESITVMVQKEVADRMQVGPGTKDYGALSLAVQYYADPYIVANVPPNCFMPRPKVGSAVIRLTRHQEPPVKVKDEKLMFKIIRASFNQRRKTLANGLNNSPEIHLPKELITASIEELGRGSSIRGEALTLQEFAALSDIISAKL